jgi:hypothetical protein
MVLWLGLLGWSDCGTRLRDAFDRDQTLLATTPAALGGDGTRRRVRAPPWQVAGLCRTTGRAWRTRGYGGPGPADPAEAHDARRRVMHVPAQPHKRPPDPRRTRADEPVTPRRSAGPRLSSARTRCPRWSRSAHPACSRPAAALGACLQVGVVKAHGVVRHDLELGQAAPGSFPSMWSVSSVRAGSKDREPRKRGGYHVRWNASRQWRQVLPRRPGWRGSRHCI